MPFQNYLLDQSRALPFGGRSRNIKTEGRGPGAVDFLGSGNCFDAPLHMLLYSLS